MVVRMANINMSLSENAAVCLCRPSASSVARVCCALFPPYLASRLGRQPSLHPPQRIPFTSSSSPSRWDLPPLRFFSHILGTTVVVEDGGRDQEGGSLISSPSRCSLNNNRDTTKPPPSHPHGKLDCLILYLPTTYYEGVLPLKKI